MKLNRHHSRLVILITLPVLAAALLSLPLFPTRGANPPEPANPYKAGAPNIDVNATAAATRQATSMQLTAINQFKTAYGNQTTLRWNGFAGSPDVMMGFHTAPSNDTPENVARSFVAANNALFGIDPSALVVVDKKEALGGYLLRFKQTAGGIDVVNGGLGFLMTADKQIRMVMGSSFRNVNVASVPVLTASAAAARAQTALAGYAVNRSANAEQFLKPAFDELGNQIAPALYAPKLNIFPTAGGYKLAWNVITYSRNPFGVYVTQVDASNGDILSRESKIRYQNPLPYTADIFPNHPTLANPDTGEFKLDGTGAPEGLLRVRLRNYDPSISGTGVNGLMSGPHALVKNVLAMQAPFPQAAMGTWHFRANNSPVETQPNEADDLAEPAEHFDDSNIFFFINYLVEYITDIHRRDDAVHSRLGQGDFPDDFPNSDRPLVGLPHFPSDGGLLIGGGADTSGPDALLLSLVGLDNAFSLPLSQTVDTPQGPQTVIVNPTVYGHGYLFNDLGKDGAGAHHEGMHSISTPIAGLEGAPEGSALNEAQADLWAYTITDAEAIGEYVVKGARARQAVRNGTLFAADTGGDPERLAWIRSVHSTLKYSHLGTRGGNAYEEHRDGEIYVATMWDLRYLLKQVEPQMSYLRPAFLNGNPTRQISQGQDTFERLHLGSLYLLGLTSPDTFIKTRDAVIEADRVLYSTDPTNLDAPGKHEALIWQVFASHEMGVNADSVVGGRQTISTKVTRFAGQQAQPEAPQSVTVEPASSNSLRISWQAVSGAVAYEVFKRKLGTEGQRQFAGAPWHTYFDGDTSITGWSHIGYVAGDTSFEDKGRISEFFAPTGLSSDADADGFNEMFGNEYAVRALAVNPNQQVGVSDLSASAAINRTNQDISAAIKTAISNVRLAGGVFEFDQTIKNVGVGSGGSSSGGSESIDGVAYGPIDFRVIHLADPTVTVKNADNGGDGRNDAALFRYGQSLARSATSNPRHLQFNDPLSHTFTFDALVTATLRTATIPVGGSQPGDGIGEGISPADVRFETHTEGYTGTLIAGSGGLALVNGIDYVDVPFVAPPHSFGVDGTLDASPASLGALPDMDFKLLDDQDNVLASSGNLGPKESLSGAVTPGRTYRYRVVGYASGPTQFVINSKQYFPTGQGPDAGGASGSGGAGSPGQSGSSFLPPIRGVRATRLVRFTVNPITKTVTFQLL
jgi:Fungalysin metallopeptidase (M36)